MGHRKAKQDAAYIRAKAIQQRITEDAQDMRRIQRAEAIRKRADKEIAERPRQGKLKEKALRDVKGWTGEFREPRPARRNKS
jgi:hypothetical protein